jgi:PRC-barrel domain
MHLRRTRDLSEYTIAAVDADIGKVDGFYFDDETWTIRYIVVKTRSVLSARKVLISPVALRKPAWRPLHLWVKLTWKQVESSPSIDLNQPVLRQHEIEHHDHYGWPYYWETVEPKPPRTGPKPRADAPRVEMQAKKKPFSRGPHLRSTREVIGYHLVATDGPIGHVEDFLFDDQTWEIRYVIVDTKNWWAGKKILLRPSWVKRISWRNRKIYVVMARKTIRGSPEWDPSRPVSRKYELHLHRYYGSAPYWTREQ